VSPDGQNVLSGSEDGKLYLWDFHTNEPYNTDHLGLSIVGPATDVDWNQGYHMFAVSGFGDEYPILVFASELEEGTDLHRVLGKMKDMEETSMRSDHIDHSQTELTRKRIVNWEGDSMSNEFYRTGMIEIEKEKEKEIEMKEEEEKI